MSGYSSGTAYGHPHLVKQRRLKSQKRKAEKSDIFYWGNNIKFCSGGEKIRNESGHLGENERQWKKSEQEHVRQFLHKTCARKFLVVVVQNNGKEMYKKSVLHVQSCFFASCFSPFSLPSPLSISRFYILFEQTINLIESFAFSPS